MLDEKEEKRQKRNVKFSLMLMICAVIIAYEYNLRGYALALSFVIGLSIMWTPVVLFWIAYYVRAKRIITMARKTAANLNMHCVGLHI